MAGALEASCSEHAVGQARGPHAAAGLPFKPATSLPATSHAMRGAPGKPAGDLRHQLAAMAAAGKQPLPPALLSPAFNSNTHHTRLTASAISGGGDTLSSSPLEIKIYKVPAFEGHSGEMKVRRVPAAAGGRGRRLKGRGSFLCWQPSAWLLLRVSDPLLLMVSLLLRKKALISKHCQLLFVSSTAAEAV